MIEVHLTINPADTKELAALTAFVAALNGNTPSATIKGEDLQPKTKQTFAAPTSKAKMEIAKDPEAGAEIEAEEAEEETQQQEVERESNDEKPTTTLEEIREVLGKKVSEHREAIKAELTKCDAKNVTVLSPKYYDKFKAFLDAL